MIHHKRYQPTGAWIDRVLEGLRVFVVNLQHRRGERIERAEFHPDDLARWFGHERA